MTSNDENDINIYTNTNQNNNTELNTINKNNIQQVSNSNQNNNQNENPQNRVIQFNNAQNINSNSQIIPINTHENQEMKVDNFAENNITIRNIIDNALLSQLSKINVKLLDLEENLAQQLYKSETNILPKIDMVEINLLKQSTNIAQFKKYGFGLYVFFLYLIELLVIFGILFIFVFHYMGCIFYNYYREYVEKYSFFFDYNILSLVSGVQIIKFRKYFINYVYESYDDFKDNYYYFDVIYKEYLYTGTIIFIIAFLINIFFMLYLQKVYKIYEIENPEIKNYSLIISGNGIPFINDEIKKEENAPINTLEDSIKNKILKELDVKEADINFTLKLSKYYEKMEKFTILKNKKYYLQYKVNRGKCCCHGCCCFCSKCFCCCCKKDNYVKKLHDINEQIDNIKNEMNDLKTQEIYNPLHIITFHNKEDYNSVYSKYPHSYIIHSIKNIFKKKNDNTIYINKAPSPEEICWKNLEFSKEHRFFKSKLENLGISLIYIAISFVIQIFGELMDKLADENIEILFIVNIIVSYLLGLLNSFFSEKIKSLLINNSNFWSYSDITFYSILFKTIFKFINQGIFPLVTYYIFAKEDDDYQNLISKMFVIIEMDGFGYPMIDWLYSVVLTKGKDMYESSQKMMNIENIEKEISDKVINQDGLSRLELEETYEKKEMDLEGNYSDILSIYWITMFYMSIYPIGIIQSFLNLLFKYIIEKNFLLNVYKRPVYINPQFGFFCFNFFNFGFFLFLCGDIIFFRNEDNKNSFGVGYIIIMLIILFIPFYLIGKLIMYLTNYCCLKEKESENLDKIKQKIKSDYRLFNPCYQKEKLQELFFEFKKKNILSNSQYGELLIKIKRLNDLDLYQLQQNLRTQKIMSFEIRKISSAYFYEYPSIKIENEELIKLYYLLMQLGFITYLEEGNVLRPKKKRIEFKKNMNIRSSSLKNLAMQENLSNCDSGYFTTFRSKDKKELIMVYVENNINVKIFDVFERKAINDVKDLKHMKKIVCVDYYTLYTQDVRITYLISIALDNTMIISNLMENKKGTNKIINNIGDTFLYNQDKNNNTFCLSTIPHLFEIWIITSYYYDKSFKIYNSEGNCLYTVQNDDYIISLEGLSYTAFNTFICVRSPNSINLFINQYFIRKVKELKDDEEEDSYINFKIIEASDIVSEHKYILMTIIKNDLSSYLVHIIDIFDVFPLYKPLSEVFFLFRFGQMVNEDAYMPMNAEVQNKIKNNSPKTICKFRIELDSTKEQRNAMVKFMESDDVEKFNIGNILLWDEQYLIVGTPFNYLDIIDFKNEVKVGVINNTEKVRNLYNDRDEEFNDIITYNISERIIDPQYGPSFIMRDNKGKIQYIRSTKVEEKINYDLGNKIEHFNDLPDDVKLEHILISTRLYFLYSIISYLVPLALAITGHVSEKDPYDIEDDDKIFYFMAFIFYIIYAIFGIWFKGCVYDIEDESHTKRTCTKIWIYFCLAVKVCANSLVSYAYCRNNKTGIIFISMLIGIYFIHLNLNYIIYCCKINFLLRTYWLGFLFYQISRFCILLFFLISILLKVDYVEIYIYAAILCVVLIYMFMANYFNTLMKKLVYNSYIQAIFNYPMEWMNLFCCWCGEPKDFIKELDFKFCVCDSFFLICLQILGWIILIAIVIAIVLCGFVLSILGGAAERNSQEERERRRREEEEERRRNNGCDIF